MFWFFFISLSATYHFFGYEQAWHDCREAGSSDFKQSYLPRLKVLLIVNISFVLFLTALGWCTQ